MPHSSSESRHRFLRYFHELLNDMEECDELDLDAALRLGEKKVRVPHPTLPLQLLLGSDDGYRLQLEPELKLAADGRFQRSGDYLLFDPSTFFSDISGFVRVRPGESVTLGREDPIQRGLLGYPKLVANKHLRVKLSGKGLALKNKAPKRGTCVAPLVKPADIDRMTRWRAQKIARLATVLNAPIEPLERSAALDLLEQTIALMEREPYRLKTRDGEAGGVLRLPSRPTPIFVGDLHACIDNLLVILTQNGFLEAIEDGSGLLILIGDAVHPDTPGQEDQMDSSMLLMDLIFRLKLRFPERVFYLRGNHDDFANDISKGGVPQGLLWEQALHEQRGSRYRDRMQALYERLPYVAVSPRFVCCHAGAPTMKASRSDLIHVRDKPKLQRQLTNLRLRKPNSPSGYGASDIKRLCKALGVSPNTPFIVGHTPLSADGTLWLDAGGIPNHHVLFGANPDQIGVLAMPTGKLLPLTYPTEPLRVVYNRLVDNGRKQP
ncbi:metallophosphoesterase [Halochromatium roseum]|uniref:metallophosphoesterase n=1 Tax=Halochromatium roseum TaxID=391920 RepID=UPI001913AA97|nr:metallophosphoesterase [Halochromatium roseum]MBK5939436.1 metallophosphoesterase [Halochromatium roseum]